MARHGKIATRAGALAWTDTGGGAPGALPALVIHGNSSCKEVFGNQLDGALGRAHRLVAVDLPGHGASDDAAEPGRDYTISGYAKAMIEAARGLGLDRYAVLGWSLGGHIALEMMALDPPSVAGAMIFGTPPLAPSPEGMQAGFRPSAHMELTGKAEFTEEDVRAFAAATCGGVPPADPVLVAAVRRTDGRARQTMVADALAGGCLDERRIVETSPIPLAVVTGVDEPFVNNAYLETLAYRNLWEAKVHVIDGAGHAPFREAPAAFDAIADRFLRALA
jgi:pimeloyl-ACP methyl ester carboxylesterase